MAVERRRFNESVRAYNTAHPDKPLAVRVAHHFIVRGGLIVRFEQFVDTALVRDAAMT